MHRVAVVGAGLAGLTCAQALKAAGVEVVVIEKSRGVGGRLSTRRAASAQYDHGAQYFTARDPVFARYVASGVAQGSVAIWQPRLQVDAPRSDTEPWYVGCPGMSSLGRAQSADLDVRTDTRVVALSRVSQKWHLGVENGDSLAGFDAVVVAVPNAQAAPLLAPHAPAWASQLEQTPMEPCWTLMFSTPEELTDLDAGLPRQSTIGWWARNSSKPGRPVVAGRHDWVVQATAVWSQANLDLPKPDVEQSLLMAFAAELGLPSVKPIDSPMVHRWLYSRRHPGLAALKEPWWMPSLGLGVCGDGLSHSRVEQAYLSGLRLGEAMTG